MNRGSLWSPKRCALCGDWTREEEVCEECSRSARMSSLSFPREPVQLTLDDCLGVAVSWAENRDACLERAKSMANDSRRVFYEVLASNANRYVSRWLEVAERVDGLDKAERGATS